MLALLGLASAGFAPTARLGTCTHQSITHSRRPSRALSPAFLCLVAERTKGHSLGWTSTASRGAQLCSTQHLSVDMCLIAPSVPPFATQVACEHLRHSHTLALWLLGLMRDWPPYSRNPAGAPRRESAVQANRLAARPSRARRKRTDRRWW
eukprot:scaffold98484_cov32-Tisochrysis_lutea.AAC.2